MSERCFITTPSDSFGFYEFTRIIHEIFIDFIILGVFIFYGFNNLVVKAVNMGIRAGHQKRGMSGNEKLGMALLADFDQKI